MKVMEIVGMYGAVLSSLVAYRQWRSARPKLTITTVSASNGPSFPPVGQFIRANVSNRGATKAFIRQAFVRLTLQPQTFRARLVHFRGSISPWHGGGRMMASLPPGTVVEPALPAMIEPGQSLVIWVPRAAYEALRDGPQVTGVQIMVQDEGDRDYSSKPARH